jgi:hypothetical protein
MRSRFAFIWVLVTALVAGLAAYIAYGAGVATHVATAGGPDGVGYYHPYFGLGFFFPVLFIVILLFWLVRPRRWMGGWGGYGMRGGFPQGVPPHLEDRLREWHSRAHGEPTTDTAPKPPADGGPTSG